MPQQGSPRDAYRWRGRFYHLTYAGHIPAQILLQLLTAISSIPVIGTSIVHEASDAESP